MVETIVIVGIDNIAATLNVGRKQVFEWLYDPISAFPAIKVGRPGRYMASVDNLKTWAKAYLKPPSNPAP